MVYSLPVNFRQIPFSSLKGEVKNSSANQRPWRPSLLMERPAKKKINVEDVAYLLSVSFVKFRSTDAEEKSKVYQPMGSQGGHLR